MKLHNMDQLRFNFTLDPVQKAYLLTLFLTKFGSELMFDYVTMMMCI
jgi:hypothetical protein